MAQAERRALELILQAVEEVLSEHAADSAELELLLRLRSNLNVELRASADPRSQPEPGA